MRKVLYVVILALVFFAPVDRLDVSKLEPVRSVAMTMKGNQIVLKTDGGRMGKGKTVKDALENLKETTPAVIYLDTAEYLLVSKNAINRVEEIMQYLKKNVMIAPYYGTDVKEETKYIESHTDRRKPKN